MGRTRLALVGLVLTFAFSISIADEAKSPAIVLKGGVIRTMTDAGDFTGTLVIRDGKIAAVGAEVAIPAGSKVIDASGCVITPGLIDAHGRLGLQSAASGESGRDGSLDALDGVDPFSDDWRDAARQGLTAVYVQPAAGGNLGGAGAVLRVCSGDCADDMALRSPAGVQVALGLAPQAPAAANNPQLGNFLRQRGITIPTQPAAPPPPSTTLTRFAQYEQVRGQFDAAKKYGADKPKHADRAKELLLKANKGEIPTFIDVHYEDDVCNALNLANEFNLKAIFEHLDRAKPLPEEIIRSKAALIIDGRASEAVRKLALDGRKFAIASLGDEPRDSAGLRFNAAAAVASGFPRTRVLEALTRDAADLLGVGDKLGRIAVGRLADLAVFAGDPLDPSAPVRLTLSQGKVTYEGRLARAPVNQNTGAGVDPKIVQNAIDTVQVQRESPRPATATPSSKLKIEPLPAFTVASSNPTERPSPVTFPDKLPASYILKTTRLLNAAGEFRPGELHVVNGKVAVKNENVASLPVFDLGDTPVTPGLVAAHVSVGGEMAADADASELRAVDGLAADDARIRRCRDGGFLTALISPGSSDVLAGMAGVVRASQSDTPEIGLKFVLTSAARSRERLPVSLAGQIELIEGRLRSDAAETSLYLPEAVRNAMLNQREKNLKAVRDRRLLACFEAQTRAEIRAALRLIAEYKLCGVLLMPRDVHELIDEIRQANVVVVLPPVKPRDPELVINGLVELSKAGVQIAFGGDPAEVRMTASWLVNAGLPRQVARRALIGQSAEALRLPAGTGRIQAGDSADYVAWTGDPLDAASRPLALVVKGERVAISATDDAPPKQTRRPTAPPARTGRRRR